MELFRRKSDPASGKYSFWENIKYLITHKGRYKWLLLAGLLSLVLAIPIHLGVSFFFENLSFVDRMGAAALAFFIFAEVTLNGQTAQKLETLSANEVREIRSHLKRVYKCISPLLIHATSSTLIMKAIGKALSGNVSDKFQDQISNIEKMNNEQLKKGLS